METDRLDVSHKLVASVARIVADLAKCAGATAQVEMILDRLRDLMGASGALIEFEQEGSVVCCYASGDTGVKLGHSAPVGSSVAGVCFSAPQMLVTSDLSRDPRLAEHTDELGSRSMIAVPFFFNDLHVGSLRIFSASSRLLSMEHLTLARLLTVTVQRVLLRALHESGETAPSTARAIVEGGLWALRDRRKTQLWRADHHDYQVSIVTCEITGYLTRQIVHQVTRHLRSTDVWYQQDAGRYAIVMPGTSVDDAATAAARIKHEIETLAAASGDEVVVKCDTRALSAPALDQRSA